MNDFQSKYLLGDEIGNGTYGKIYKCTRLSDGDKFVVKIDQGKDEKYIDFKAEVDAYSVLKHPNIVKMIEIFEEYPKPRIVFDIEEGDLIKFMKIEKTRDYDLCIAKSIALGLQHMHKNGRAHLDIKFSNILYSAEDSFGDEDNSSPKYRFKICDMGNSITEKDFPNVFPGTSLYMDASIYKAQKDKFEGWVIEDLFKVDVWSLGIMMLELSTCRSIIKSIIRHKLIKSDRIDKHEVIDWSDTDFVEWILSFEQKDFDNFILMSYPMKLIENMVVVDPKERKDINWVVENLSP